jgi:hypothetical protein
MEDVDPVALYIEFQAVAICAHEMRYVDHRKGIRAFDNHKRAVAELLQQFARTQNWQGAFKAAEIEITILAGFRHHEVVKEAERLWGKTAL